MSLSKEDDLLTGTFAPSSLSPTPLSASTSIQSPPSVPRAVESGRGHKRRAEITDYQRELLEAVNKPLDEDGFL